MLVLICFLEVSCRVSKASFMPVLTQPPTQWFCFKYFKIIFGKARKQGATRSFEKGCFPLSKLQPCCQAPTTGPEDGLPARAILTYDSKRPTQGEERDPSPLTSKVDFKKTPIWSTSTKRALSSEQSSPGNSRKLTCTDLNVYHTLWHTEVFQRWHLSTFSICCLWFFCNGQYFRTAFHH